MIWNRLLKGLVIHPMNINGLTFAMATVLTLVGLSQSPIVVATSSTADASTNQDPEGLPPSAGAISGVWRPLATQPSFSVDVCLLLTDATVMCHKTHSPDWWRLIPDAFGGYVNGTWSQLPSMDSTYGPAKFASAVLADGRVAIVGGALNLGVATPTNNKGSIYDRRLNAWTTLTAPIAIGNSPSAVLPDGTFLVSEWNSTRVAALDPVTLGWTVMTPPGKLDNNHEEGWTLLPDGTLLTVDVTNPGNTAEKYIPATGQWVGAGNPPALAASCVAGSPSTTWKAGGPAVLRPNGTVFVAGATGHTAIYTPGALTSPGTWIPGPNFPILAGDIQLGVNDGPAALLPNGNVLIMASPIDCTVGSRMFEFDGTTLTDVAAPARASVNSSDLSSMLVLPTGEILLTDLSNNIEIYTPAGSANPAWAPTITSVPSDIQPGVTYKVEGARFNGLSQGASYGAEFNAATNYPVVRITNRATGHVAYARTHDHSTMAVATAAPGWTFFDVPLTIELGASDIEVVANGIASAKSPLNVGQSTCPGTLPSILIHPQSQMIISGQTASVSVVGAGTGLLTYQWYIGASGNTTIPIVGATSSTYTTPASTSTTSYWVRVSNACGTVDSVTATITIGAGRSPAITTQPESQTLKAGYTASLSLAAFGNAPLTYQWYVGASGDTASPIAGATANTYTTPTLTGTTSYWARVSNAFGVMNSNTATIRVIALDDIVADFGPPFGLWFRDGATGSWPQLHTVSARNIVTGDLDGNGLDEMIGDFGASAGIWILYNNSRWVQLHALTASHMAVGDFDGDGKAELAIDFPGFGIWVWANDAWWYRLHPSNSSNIVVGDLDGNGQQEAIIDFNVHGIWVWSNNASWSQLHPFRSRLMTVGDFDGNGQDDVVVDFVGYGLWKYENNTAWSAVHGLSAAHMANGDVDANGQSDLIVDFGSAYGIWLLKNGNAWSQLHTLTSTKLLAGDLDANRHADVIINFGTAGLWEYANDAGWIQLHPLSPRVIAIGHINGP